MQNFLFKLDTSYIDVTHVIESPTQSNELTLIYFLEKLRKYENRNI